MLNFALDIGYTYDIMPSFGVNGLNLFSKRTLDKRTKGGYA